MSDIDTKTGGYCASCLNASNECKCYQIYIQPLKQRPMNNILQNLPPKVREKLQEWLKNEYGYELRHIDIYLICNAKYCAKYHALPEPAVIGLLTAWLESEGWTVENRYYFEEAQCVISHENNRSKQIKGIVKFDCLSKNWGQFKDLAFYQAFAKVVQAINQTTNK